MSLSTRQLTIKIEKLTAKTALFVAAFSVATSYAAEATIAQWDFSQTEGPVANMQVKASNEAAVSHNGWVGYSPDTSDDSEVNRDGTRAAFNGQRNSIILIDDTNHAQFNPENESLVIAVEFKVDQSALSDQALAPKGTWNLIQKGRFNNKGGQWKMQIRKAPDGRLFLQCLINDDRPDTKREAAQTVLDKNWLKSGDTFNGRCTLNRQQNTLNLELNNLTTSTAETPVTTALRANFGNVAPIAGECGSPNAFGGSIAIGNKPLCPNQKLDTDDAFRGEVFGAQIMRF